MKACSAAHLTASVAGYPGDGCSAQSVSSACVNRVAHGQFIGSRNLGLPARFTMTALAEIPQVAWRVPGIVAT